MRGRTVPEPSEQVGRRGDQVESVHGVSDHLGDGPGEEEEREPNRSARRREKMENEPGDVDPRIVQNINNSEVAPP